VVEVVVGLEEEGALVVFAPEQVPFLLARIIQ
jgi:hypothetical protein